MQRNMRGYSQGHDHGRRHSQELEVLQPAVVLAPPATNHVADVAAINAKNNAIVQQELKLMSKQQQLQKLELELKEKQLLMQQQPKKPTTTTNENNNNYNENNNHRHLATHLRPPVPPPRNRIVRGKKASPDALLVGGPVCVERVHHGTGLYTHAHWSRGVRRRGPVQRGSARRSKPRSRRRSRRPARGRARAA